MIIYIILAAITQGVFSVEIRQLTLPAGHTECPTWDNRTGILYYVDVFSGEILGFDYEKNEIVKNITLENSSVAPVLQTKVPNVFLVGRGRTLVSVDVDSEDLKMEELATLPHNAPNSMFNDGKVDNKGRVWLGTMGYTDQDGNLDPDAGALYLFVKGNLENPEVVISPVNVSNGMAWTKANDKLYYIDSPTRQIVGYDFDSEHGKIYNKKVAFDLADTDLEGVPDGMTIDADDNLWVALYGGGAIIQVDPIKNSLIRKVLMPATYVTSAAWGGPRGDVLFVTTSGLETNGSEPAAGAVFAVTELDAKGLLPFEADVF